MVAEGNKSLILVLQGRKQQERRSKEILEVDVGTISTSARGLQRA